VPLLLLLLSLPLTQWLVWTWALVPLLLLPLLTQWLVWTWALVPLPLLPLLTQWPVWIWVLVPLPLLPLLLPLVWAWALPQSTSLSLTPTVLRAPPHRLSLPPRLLVRARCLDERCFHFFA